MALPRLFFAAARNWRRVVPLALDRRVPTQLKVAAGALGLLILSPLDIFSDVPILGLFDDAVLLTLLCSLFVWIATLAVERELVPMKNVTPGIGGPPMAR